jgi:hypothetical protein
MLLIKVENIEQGLKFKRCLIGCHMGCHVGCLNTNKKQITESVSNLRDEFIKLN